MEKGKNIYALPALDSDIEKMEFSAIVINNCKILRIQSVPQLLERMKWPDKAFKTVFGPASRNEVELTFSRKGINVKTMSRFQAVALFAPMLAN